VDIKSSQIITHIYYAVISVKSLSHFDEFCRNFFKGIGKRGSVHRGGGVHVKEIITVECTRGMLHPSDIGSSNDNLFQ